jgi:hypothetical protein
MKIARNLVLSKMKAMKTRINSKGISNRIKSILLVTMVCIVISNGQSPMKCKNPDYVSGHDIINGNRIITRHQAGNPDSSKLVKNKGPRIDNKTISLSIQSSEGKLVWDINDANTNNDRDQENNEIFYLIISGNTQEVFDINQLTGEIRIINSAKLCNPLVKNYRLLVYAGTETDGDDAIVEINLLDY